MKEGLTMEAKEKMVFNVSGGQINVDTGKTTINAFQDKIPIIFDDIEFEE